MKKVIFVLLFLVIIVALVRGIGGDKKEVVFDKIESDLPELLDYYLALV